MTTKTETAFDLAAFKRAIESGWDRDNLAGARGDARPCRPR
jgi:hypothetical protein